MSQIANSITGDNGSNGTIARTLETAASSAHRAIDQATGIARPAVDDMAAGAHHAVDQRDDAASSATAALRMRSRQLRDAQVRLAESCRSQVRDQPMAAVGIAAAGGFLLGWLLRR